MSQSYCVKIKNASINLATECFSNRFIATISKVSGFCRYKSEFKIQQKIANKTGKHWSTRCEKNVFTAFSMHRRIRNFCVPSFMMCIFSRYKVQFLWEWQDCDINQCYCVAKIQTLTYAGAYKAERKFAQNRFSLG